MDESPRQSVPLPLVWVLAAIVIALLALTATLASGRLAHRHGGAAGLSSAEQRAVDAAKQETINIQTYRLKSFDADFAVAVAGLTEAKATQWQANKSTLKANLTSQKIDSGATVSGAGLVSFDRKSAVVVVSSDTQRIDSTGKSTTAAQNRFQVTMRLVGGKWLMDDLQSVSLS
jgi:Mce-associated membrane protein